MQSATGLAAEEVDSLGHPLTTYLAAGSAMLYKTAASKSNPLGGLKSKASVKGSNPVAGAPLLANFASRAARHLQPAVV